MGTSNNDFISLFLSSNKSFVASFNAMSGALIIIPLVISAKYSGTSA
jgi:hypothetical protein